jgi:Transposase and inactivated derivatives
VTELQKAQQEVSRREKGSNRRRKAVAKLAKAHDKVSNQRRDIAHKITNMLINDYDLIAHEKLQIKNMVKNKHLSKAYLMQGGHILQNSCLQG